jgi:3-deoxy-D-manno-octulosonic-acid transferase
MTSLGLEMRAYRLARVALQPVMALVLRRRLRRGKEDPQRYREKLGEPSLPRPEGRLVWIHAVGLGEVLALRPLIASLHRADPALEVLLTSTARSSAQVIGQNLPPNTRHQLLPLDGPSFVRRFLDHWRPDLSVWSEQDIWPGAVHDTAARGIPLAYVNARMNAASMRRRARLGGLYRDTLRRFALVTAQDAESAAHLEALGAREVRVQPSLKPAAEPLHADPAELARLRALLAGRRVWVAASTHAPDEAMVIPAQARLAARDPAWLLILTPRLPARRDEIAGALRAAGLSFALRSQGQDPGPDTAVLLADSFGELGLWYRLAEVACVGGSFGGLGGHNPWEAVTLGLPVISGPDTANFRLDYEQLQAAGLARQVQPGPDAPPAIADLVGTGRPAEAQERARDLVAAARRETDRLAQDLLALMQGVGA